MCLCSILWKINNAEGKEYALALHFLSYLYQWVFCCISQKYSLRKSMCSFGGCDTLQGFAKIPWSNSDNQWTILVLFLIAAVSHCWLLWTCVSHQLPVHDSDIPVLPSARSHCTWTTQKGRVRTPSGTCCQFLEWNWACASSQTLSVLSVFKWWIWQLWFTGVGFAIPQGMFSRKESLFSSSILMFGNRGLFPAEILASGECSQCGPLGGSCWAA